ncbi:hydroxymethylglutaryl-CoA lyase [Mucilaginibacter jinjuensis]|uniref:Hydroxymethylglutaryl-CoA lyase n=1 Tax=Mucilaginibacter jinjuensis TaxID=1176721 RepID=A0ABY7T0Y2_9SPHI|nr:hydroxymethylglutaryl-CoA lyase [Mucilaginibacter jinjuensis]WCT09874.1 hydroxymethylglutaryl-CoA lyase [Mucilaginibacter jinjuensis]
MKIIECPRDAIQGIKHLISTEAKAHYINQLLRVGFDTIDFGSFVSAKAIPQMVDTAAVLDLLDMSNTKSKLLAIVANERGAAEACEFEQIACLGYPFSISETFQLRNTGATITESVDRVKVMQELCMKHNKQLVIYISMGFGNPYGDEWNSDIAIKWVEELSQLQINVFSLADTVGVADPQSISYMFNNLIPAFPELEFGAHLHTTASTVNEKLEAAWQAGCRRFDGAILGYGGCPMAQDELVGNMPTEQLVDFMLNKNQNLSFDKQQVLNLEPSFKQLIAH